MFTTITYDESGVTYDDHCYLYDGHNICDNPLPVDIQQPRPNYWLGTSSQKRRERDEQQSKINHLAITIRSKLLSVNDFKVNLDETEVRFSGENGKLTVVGLNKSYPVISEPMPSKTEPTPAAAAVEVARSSPQQEAIFEVQMIPEITASIVTELDEPPKIQVQASVLISPEPRIEIYCEHPIITVHEMSDKDGRTDKNLKNES